MRGRKFQIVFAILLLLVMASPGSAARRSSLSGNLLIEDKDDMFFFPQLVSANKRMVTFDFGTDAGLGSGGMVFGTESLSLGLFAHRSDFLSPLESAFLTRGDIDNIGNDGTADMPEFGIGDRAERAQLDRPRGRLAVGREPLGRAPVAGAQQRRSRPPRRPERRDRVQPGAGLAGREAGASTRAPSSRWPLRAANCRRARRTPRPGTSVSACATRPPKRATR